MSADWDIFVDEAKVGGTVEYLACLVFEAGVTEGIHRQLLRARGAVQRRGIPVGEIHWRCINRAGANVAKEWLSLSLSSFAARSRSLSLSRLARMNQRALRYVAPSRLSSQIHGCRTVCAGSRRRCTSISTQVMIQTYCAD